MAPTVPQQVTFVPSTTLELPQATVPQHVTLVPPTTIDVKTPGGNGRTTSSSTSESTYTSKTPPTIPTVPNTIAPTVPEVIPETIPPTIPTPVVYETTSYYGAPHTGLDVQQEKKDSNLGKIAALGIAAGIGGIAGVALSSRKEKDSDEEDDDEDDDEENYNNGISEYDRGRIEEAREREYNRQRYEEYYNSLRGGN